MKILLLAPHPFYQERGTPIAVDLLLQALSERGETVDVLTYHEGEDRAYPGVRLHRIRPAPGLSGVGPGPSVKKLLCDIALFFSALRMARRGGYDLVHAVEESVFVAMLVRWRHKVPYVYDMDSSLAEQMMEKYGWLRTLRPLLRWWERQAIRHAATVVPVCDALAETARAAAARRVVVLRDICLTTPQNGAAQQAAEDIHRQTSASGQVVLYIGNLERYQGIDLLLQSFALARRQVADVHLVIIGGAARAVAAYQAQARALSLDGSAHFLGPRPVQQLGSYLLSADVLVSPRISGRNTPMKIYSYLGAGRAILATDLPTHTQVLTSETAMLTAPEPQAFSAAMVRLLTDAALRDQLGQAARQAAETRHSYAVFKRTVSELYDTLEQQQEDGH